MKNKYKFILKNHGTFLAVLGIILFSLLVKLFSLGNQLENGITLSNTLDFSWTSDSVERLLHGYIAGKDFIFTYGPLFQLIYAIPSLLFHYPSFFGPLIISVFLQIPIIIFIFTIAGFITSDKKSQLLLTLFLQFVIGLLFFPDTNTLIRILIPFVYAVLYTRTRLSSVMRKNVILTLPTIFGLYSFDNFIVCSLITIFIECYFFFKTPINNNAKKNISQLLFSLGYAIGLILIFEIIASLILSHSLEYINSSVDTLRSYQYIMNIPFSINANVYLWIYFLSNILLSWYVLSKEKYSKTINNNLFILLFVSVLQLKSFLIRSDDGHLIMAIYPSLLMTFILLYLILQRKMNIVFVVLFCFLYTFIPFKDNSVSILSTKSLQGLKKVANPNLTFSDIYILPHNYYYSKEDFMNFDTLITENKGKVMVYPYDTYILNNSHSTFNTYALQFYEYSNSFVEKKSVETLTKNPPKYIILGVDTKSASNLDDIPNFSRNPQIAKWMLTNYSVYKEGESYLLLINDNKKIIKNNTSVNCPVFELNTGSIMKSSFIENITKTSTYYLDQENEKRIRLPYSPYSTTTFIIPSATNVNKLSQLFSLKWYFMKYEEFKKTDITMIKKYPIPKVIKEYRISLLKKCY
jgi:hypothetical protein